MRIQHNIMAMNAYRNYTNNVSAMKTNLEKLSSGYKINRAGDDAAGLAISEKMRAQITGLETAQKNAKDGISLVQTAEGALTEVHDMLNRMVELATQSANGTYDNTTDRAQLQKEMDQLKSEIDRIADSSNFNGIKLLDGSMAIKDAVAAGSTTESVTVDGMDRIITSVIGKGEKPYEVAGNKTILDGKGAAAAKATFAIDLNTLDFSTKTGEAVGSTTYSVASGALKQSITIGSKTYTQVKTAATSAIPAGSAGTFTITVATAGGTAAVNLTATVSSTGTVTIKTTGGTDVTSKVAVTATPNTQTVASGTTASVVSITIAGTKLDTKAFSVDSGDDSAAIASKVAAAIADKIDEDGGEVTINGVKWTVTASAGKLTFSQVNMPETADEARANFDVSINIKNAGEDDTNNTLKIQLVDPTTNTKSSKVTLDMAASIKAGTYVSNPGVAKEDANKANTIFRIDESDLVDGAQIAIGNKTIVLKVGDSNVDESKYTGASFVELDDGADLNTALSKISNAIGSTFNMKIVGKDANGNDAEYEITFQIGVSDTSQGFPAGLAIQRVTTAASDIKDGMGKDLKFDSLEKLAANFKLQKSKTTVTEAQDAQRGLTLQIGDTADSYNQLVVSIGDMHVSSLGLGDVKISDQESAAQAVEAIKNAINQVSDLRGTLGATQNRLDHTINNLSVMTENIQDAESTIRDTDVADEMMAYTKNNILIQSAQAMLAQANQVPQGVLQLLQ